MNKHHTILNAALNVELSAQGTVPDWIELIPAGDTVSGRDARAWVNSQPQNIIDAFTSRAMDIPLDWEHASELKAPQGERAPAAGWIKALEIRDGAIWGRVVWTKEGSSDVAAQRYRYLSPVFQFTKESREIVALTSVALTNQPNLLLAALNRETPSSTPNHQLENDMQLPIAICQALGLTADATEAQVVSAIGKLNSDHATALNQAQNPSLEKYAPRDELETALNRAKAAEASLSELKTANQNAEIDSVLDKHQTRFVPAKREHYKALCQQQGGVALFEQLMDGAPELVPKSGLDEQSPDTTTTALNSEEKAAADALGISHEDYGKAKEEK